MLFCFVVVVVVGKVVMKNGEMVEFCCMVDDVGVKMFLQCENDGKVWLLMKSC